MKVAQLGHAKDNHFKRTPDSPLRPDDRKNTGLRYFAEDASLRCSPTLDRTAAGDVEEIEMSNGSTTRVRRVDVVRFDGGGERGELVAFEQGEEILLPFRAARAGPRPTAPDALSR